jgi:SAM-dependent methyltransferase
VAHRSPETPALSDVSAAYDAASSRYIERFASADLADVEDRDLISTWARAVSGPVLDAGCGPGHWSAHLRSLGLTVEGVDATPEFVAHARRAHPEIPFRVGDLRTTVLEPGSLGGVLAWFSLIHADPTEVPEVLASFARALAPGGSVLLGFFSGPRLHPFDHRVVTAWAWPTEELAAAVESVGLEVVRTQERVAQNGRINASLLARRPS